MSIPCITAYLGEVGQRVQTQPVRGGLGVVLKDELEVFEPNAKALGHLQCIVLIILAVALQPRAKVLPRALPGRGQDLVVLVPRDGSAGTAVRDQAAQQQRCGELSAAHRARVEGCAEEWAGCQQTDCTVTSKR